MFVKVQYILIIQSSWESPLVNREVKNEIAVSVAQGEKQILRNLVEVMTKNSLHYYFEIHSID